jgi:hypothetical protein
MSAAERDAVLVGMNRVRDLSRRWYRIQDDAEAAALKALSREERAELEAILEEQRRGQATGRSVLRYWDILWLELVENVVRTAVTDVRHAERALIERARKSGCLCAKEGIREC